MYKKKKFLKKEIPRCSLFRCNSTTVHYTSQKVEIFKSKNSFLNSSLLIVVLGIIHCFRFFVVIEKSRCVYLVLKARYCKNVHVFRFIKLIDGWVVWSFVFFVVFRTDFLLLLKIRADAFCSFVKWQKDPGIFRCSKDEIPLLKKVQVNWNIIIRCIRVLNLRTCVLSMWTN